MRVKLIWLQWKPDLNYTISQFQIILGGFPNQMMIRSLQKIGRCSVSELKLKFGKRIRQLRRSRDMTQEQLAELIGRSINFVSLVENGDSAPSFETIEKLARVFEIEVLELFRFERND
jgi:DNA-binding XRE family transcriptional regulator